MKKFIPALNTLVNVRPGEARQLLLGFTYFLSLLSGYTLLRPLRDALGLVGGAGELQWLFSLTFVAMLAIIPVFGWLVRRWSPGTFVAIAYRFFAANILLFCVLMATGTEEKLVARSFFVWVSVYNLFVVSVFWSVLSDCFTREQGTRLFGFIAAGGTLGTFIGPLLANLLSAVSGPVGVTLAAAVMLEISVRCSRALIRNAPAHPGTGTGDDVAETSNGERNVPIGGGILAGATLVFRSPTLLLMVCYMFFHTSMATFLYFEQGRIVSATLTNTAERTRYFAQVDLIVSCITLLLQMFISGRLMQRFGIVVGLVVLPLAAAMAIGTLGIWPTLAVLAVMQGIRRAADFALSRPAREVIFTSLSREEKYKAKNFIDTVVYRGGDVVSGWMSAALHTMGMRFPAVALMLMPLLLLWAWTGWSLARRQAVKTA